MIVLGFFGAIPILFWYIPVFAVSADFSLIGMLGWKFSPNRCKLNLPTPHLSNRIRLNLPQSRKTVRLGLLNPSLNHIHLLLLFSIFIWPVWQRLNELYINLFRGDPDPGEPLDDDVVSVVADDDHGHDRECPEPGANEPVQLTGWTEPNLYSTRITR